MKKMCILTVLIFLLLFASPVFAISITVTPIQDSHTSISDKDCGSITQTSFSITDNGAGGVLCWYYTSEDSTKRKLTDVCVRPSQTEQYNVNLNMPASGTKTVTVQLECYDFWNIISDTCVDTYSESEAINNDWSCANANGIGCNGNTMAPRYFDLSCEAIQFTLTPSKTTVDLLSGDSETITITVTNQMTKSITCDQGVETVSAGGSNSNYKLTVSAPSTGSGTKYETATVTCTWSGGTSLTQSATITVNYQSDPCVAALAAARTTISDAQSEIVNAQTKIQEANNLGSDVTNAQASLNQANSYLSTAQSDVSTAQSTCDSGDKTTGVSQANGAKGSATQAKTYATTALNSAQQAITEFEQKKGDASNKISDANSAIDNAILMITKAEDVLDNATALSSVMPEAVLGLDLVAHKADINTARVKIEQARNYMDEAQSSFDLNTASGFNSAKSKADSASTLASESNDLATNSYTQINTVLMTLGEAAKAIMSASTEISETDEILDKMNYIVRSVEEWNVDLAEAKTITTEGQTNIDEAKDLLSQAKNRLQAGVSSDAVDKAIAARDKAAEPTNRLKRIVDSVSTKTEGALDMAYSSASSKIDTADANVIDAANTYMATQSEVTAAQEDLAAAKSQLANATSLISEAKGATGLTAFLVKASGAFEVLNDVETKVNSANAHANAAKMGMYLTVGVAGAGVAGATGGGFLYWRRKKSKKPKIVKELEKEVEKIEKRIEKVVEKPKGKRCKKCGAKLGKGVKFCPKCGKKV